ncbi:MAG: hypothetical protein ACFFGZ_10270 [Candidatus Thorarchaeota archaeon]
MTAIIIEKQEQGIVLLSIGTAAEPQTNGENSFFSVDLDGTFIIRDLDFRTGQATVELREAEFSLMGSDFADYGLYISSVLDDPASQFIIMDFEGEELLTFNFNESELRESGHYDAKIDFDVISLTWKADLFIPDPHEYPFEQIYCRFLNFRVQFHTPAARFWFWLEDADSLNASNLKKSVYGNFTSVWQNYFYYNRLAGYALDPLQGRGTTSFNQTEERIELNQTHYRTKIWQSIDWLEYRDLRIKIQRDTDNRVFPFIIPWLMVTILTLAAMAPKGLEDMRFLITTLLPIVLFLPVLFSLSPYETLDFFEIGAVIWLIPFVLLIFFQFLHELEQLGVEKTENNLPRTRWIFARGFWMIGLPLFAFSEALETSSSHWNMVRGIMLWQGFLILVAAYFLLLARPETIGEKASVIRPFKKVGEEILFVGQRFFAILGNISVFIPIITFFSRLKMTKQLRKNDQSRKI